ncbi:MULTISPECIES: anhydro-N-acetylmuramic acid kinase [Xanthomonas]|uniref:Anhydro-N-acetylmuramic acid kinase n=1 Tax=Xanthomonas phaseoli pv. dieffenbachiae TaxID=92828 RepID=A0A1V9HDZ2_9XANT|nr:anhydro-N-acetylmuramic acid kinase [Xanthomonas phaseoli]MBO9766241.1 anhydro-N-acetylmuramic acid kinase [Xanthomonas phaseoli pv. dieffenbachiae]MBO9775786.1 anhydro-N-acetylmuramic acid kinase [Xanthomonas phaseoli pv. dieffenbachiae]MBO9779512.1 anhydro-N-acetylmuramic acid kinase [Xanthomonas phaseoli pv. dieffenbachiae]MBO9787313.1 anhydro-N-acetylmuramic acid kinase [Xanthomonas phaseoli pv. dieffenbachiae]MBO9797493.1 anhydro-N-acetylmuramic acid kinase [Xanthomonas phaseoli pv. di
MSVLEHVDSPLYLGLMSGTSADGIDAALVRFADATHRRCELVAGATVAWEPQLRQTLVAIGQGAETVAIDALGQLDAQVGLAFAAAANQLIGDSGVERRQIRAIGSHGQTIRHRPNANPTFTWQIGDASRIAEHTGITTVADFRRRDVAARGQGAPLMPAFHLAMLGAGDEDRAVLNLGGIGNLTLIARDGAVLGFDTGPANALLDSWCQRHHGTPFDAEGAFAASGRVDAALLQALLADPWFALPPPKSTGREQFHLDWAVQAMGSARLDAADVQATLLELTAASVADALLRLQPTTRRVLVCGGGVRNPVLLARLVARLPGMVVESSAQYGLDPDYLEAMGFAWLAAELLAGRAANLPSVTGAAGPRLLGAIYPA